MQIRIRLHDCSEAITYMNITTTYTKGPLFCILYNDGRVQKIPLINIFDVQHDYGNK